MSLGLVDGWLQIAMTLAMLKGFGVWKDSRRRVGGTRLILTEAEEASFASFARLDDASGVPSVGRGAPSRGVVEVSASAMKSAKTRRLKSDTACSVSTKSSLQYVREAGRGHRSYESCCGGVLKTYRSCRSPSYCYW